MTSTLIESAISPQGEVADRRVSVIPNPSVGQFWGLEPKPLRKPDRPDPYPVERLPPIIKRVVEDLADYVQAPTALIAGCALSVVSAAVQTRFSVRRDALLSGPATLYIMTVAQSGERKTAVDNLLLQPIREWEAAQSKEYRKAKKQYDDDLEVWEARLKDLREKAAFITTPTDGNIDPLELHRQLMPKEPRLAQILRGDDTPEALARHLADYPLAAVISAEAGIIFGSHGMKAENVTSSLAQANIVWDGGPLRQERISRESIHVEQMRVTMGLQVQPGVLKSFMQKTGNLANDIGFLARFLFSHPESTQGNRSYKEAPSDMSGLLRFRDRITTILNMPAVFDTFDRLETIYVDLDPQAFECWRNFHDEVEDELSDGRDFSHIKGVASKAAENSARLACCLHVFEHDIVRSDGAIYPIEFTTMDRACALMRWYLDEAARFGRSSELTEEMRNAELLEEWLVRHTAVNPKVPITVNMVRQKGPGALRDRKKLEAALDLLADHQRIRIAAEPASKSRFIFIALQVADGLR